MAADQFVGAGLAGVGGAGVVGVGGVALPPRILNITVPQVGHLPLIALRPFFIVSSTPSTISFLALHLTQYPSGIEKFQTFKASCLKAWEYLRVGLLPASTRKSYAENYGKTF